MKVLLTEANADFLDRLADGLRREGFIVITVSEGEEALDRWRADSPDVVVLDMDLPRLSSFEVCRQIREQGRTPVILLSAVNTEEHRVRGFRVGADDWVAKPIGSAELALRIRAVWQWAVGDLAP